MNPNDLDIAGLLDALAPTIGAGSSAALTWAPDFPTDVALRRFATWPEIIDAIGALPPHISAPVVCIYGECTAGTSVGQVDDTWPSRNVRFFALDPSASRVLRQLTFGANCKLEGLAELTSLGVIIASPQAVVVQAGNEAPNPFQEFSTAPTTRITNCLIANFASFGGALIEYPTPSTPGYTQGCLVLHNVRFSTFLAVLRVQASARVAVRYVNAIFDTGTIDGTGSLYGAGVNLTRGTQTANLTALLDSTPSTNAADLPYTPATPANWPTVPATVKAALDRLGAVPSTLVMQRVPIEYLVIPYRFFWLIPVGIRTVDITVFIDSPSVPVSAGTYTLRLERSSALPVIGAGVISTPNLLTSLDLKNVDQNVGALALAGTADARYYKVVITASNPDLAPAPIGGVPQGYIHWQVRFNP